MTYRPCPKATPRSPPNPNGGDAASLIVGKAIARVAVNAKVTDVVKAGAKTLKARAAIPVWAERASRAGVVLSGRVAAKAAVRLKRASAP